MNDNSKQSAFPVFLQEGLSHNSHVDVGLTKREYFAAMAMQAYLTGVINVGGNNDEVLITQMAVRYADALLKELNKET